MSGENLGPTGNERPHFELGQSVKISVHYSVIDGVMSDALCPSTRADNPSSGTIISYTLPADVVDPNDSMSLGADFWQTMAIAECSNCDFQETLAIRRNGRIVHSKTYLSDDLDHPVQT